MLKKFLIFINLSLSIICMDQEINFENLPSLVSLCTNQITQRLINNLCKHQTSGWFDKNKLPIELQELISDILFKQHGAQIFYIFHSDITCLYISDDNINNSCIELSHNNKFLVTQSGERALIWDTQNGKLICTLIGHLDNINAIAISNNDQFIVTASYDNIIKVWDAKNWPSYAHPYWSCR